MSEPQKFRKKPVVIDAVRNDGTWPPIIAFLNSIEYGVAVFGKPAVRRQPEDEGALQIDTLEGTMRCEIGDWLICGVKGELYPCKPDIFSATYEEE